MTLLAHQDLQGRSAYQPVIRKTRRPLDRLRRPSRRQRRSIRSPASAEDNGTSIVDVTDPRKPRYVAHIPGEPGLGETGGAQMVRVCDGASCRRAITSKVYLLRTFGNLAHEIWDVTDPAKPVAASTTVVDKLKGTHKNWWECDTGIAYLVSGVAGLAHAPHDAGLRPLRSGAAGVHPQLRPAGPAAGRDRRRCRPDLHGPISTGPKGNRVYFGYGTNKDGVLQIVDREKLLAGPQGADRGEPALPAGRHASICSRDERRAHHAAGPRHAARPSSPRTQGGADARLRDRSSTSQIVNECREPRQMVWFVDVTAEAKPFGVVELQRAREDAAISARAAGASARTRPTRTSRRCTRKRLVFVAWFNAGVRAIDIRDPVPPAGGRLLHPGDHRTRPTSAASRLQDGKERCKVAIQTNNLEVDDRGYIYIVDRANTGMHILELNR